MSETRHQIRSVSDLYASDEIEVLLLEEIRDLEPRPAYSKPEDIQDFEIAGSRTGGRISSQSSELDSPGVHSTIHSWDSHANYHGRSGHGDRRHGSSANTLPWPGGSHFVLYCDVYAHLRTTPGFLRLLLLVTSMACLITLCSSGTAKVSLFMLPLVGRLRFMVFVAVLCLLVTALLLFLDISHVIYIFPFNWTKLNVWIFTCIGTSYATASALLIFSVLEYYANGWVPRRTRSQLTAAAVLGVSCALLAFLLTWFHIRRNIIYRNSTIYANTPNQFYKPVTNSSSAKVTLKERSQKQLLSWAVQNQQPTKHNVGTHANSTKDPNTVIKKLTQYSEDHWASTRQHFVLHDRDDNGIVTSPSHRVEGRDFEQMHGIRRRDSGDNLSIHSGTDYTTATSKRSGDDSKLHRVPRTLPFQTIASPHQSRESDGVKPSARISSTTKDNMKSAHLQTTNTDDLHMYWENAVKHVGASQTISGREILQATVNGLSWGMVNTGKSKNRKPPQVPTFHPSTWSEQWDELDTVQPCSSTTVDPYKFT